MHSNFLDASFTLYVIFTCPIDLPNQPTLNKKNKTPDTGVVAIYTLVSFLMNAIQIISKLFRRLSS